MGARAVALIRELQRRFAADRAGNLAAAISMRAFLALFPILVLCIAVVGLFVGDATAFADRIVSALGLSGDAARLITDATRTAQQTKVASSVIGIVGGLAVDTMLFLWTAWILPARRIPVRAMLPAAVVGGVGYEVLKLLGGYAVPEMVSRSSTLYGTIGVVFALLVWMLVLGYLLVTVALSEKVLWDQGASRSRDQEPSAART